MVTSQLHKARRPHSVRLEGPPAPSPINRDERPPAQSLKVLPVQNRTVLRWSICSSIKTISTLHNGKSASARVSRALPSDHLPKEPQREVLHSHQGRQTAMPIFDLQYSTAFLKKGGHQDVVVSLNLASVTGIRLRTSNQNEDEDREISWSPRQYRYGGHRPQKDSQYSF